MGTMQLALALAGEKIVIAGLALQVTTFVVFLAAAIDFHIRMSKTSKTSLDSEDIAWKKMIRILYTVSTLILFRCAFRLIEYSMGNAAYLISHEWTLYVFDGMPMFVVLVLFFVFQPAELNAPQESKERDSSDGETGIAGA